MRALGVALALLGACGRFGFAPTQPPDAADATDATASNDLVAWYPMDDLGVGSQLMDHSGYRHDAACAAMPCPTLVAGRFGNAIAFDGTERFAIASTPELKTTVGWTMMVWMRFQQPARGHLFTKAYGGGILDSWAIVLEVNQTLTLFADNPSQQVLGSTQSIPLDTWQHVSARWDGIVAELFFDGQRVAAGNFGPSAWDDSDVSIGADFEFGGTASPYLGWLDDVRIYRRALGNAEIGAIMLGN